MKPGEGNSKPKHYLDVIERIVGILVRTGLALHYLLELFHDKINLNH